MTVEDPNRRRSHERFHALQAATDEGHRRSLREGLVADHLPLAAHLARRFANRGIADDDLLQVASLGLLHAVDRFDPDRGVEFSTFAAPTILGELKRHFRDRGWAVRVPRRLQELNLRLTTVADELTHQLGRSPTIAELSAAVHVSDEEVLEALDAARAYRARSISRPTADHDGAGESAPDDLRADDLAFIRSEERMVVDRLLGTLPPREQLMLRMRFYEEMTQQEIADRLGVSQMQVSRLLAKVLGQLRERLAAPDAT